MPSGSCWEPASRQPSTLVPMGEEPRTTRGEGGLPFRPDIQGMRAIAVLLVALQHAGVPHVTGGYVGVDVFFVVSGFLITGLLLRRADATGSVGIGRFYAARAKRILPAATLTLVTVCLAAVAWLNYVRATDILHDAMWCAAFAANIHFAQIGSDYFAQASPPSPLQHFWTLAVEEQFYLVWPLMLGTAVMLLGRRRSGRGPRHAAVPRLPLALLLGAIIAASLAWSIVDTQSSPQTAYFSTLTRAWELAVGALLAVGAARLARLPAGLRWWLGWAGLAGVLCAGTLYSPGTEFPGYAALLPVGAAALLVVAGMGAPAGGAPRLLSLRPFTFVGDVSYSFYLWHWPALIMPMLYVGHDLSLAQNLLLLAAAFALSVVTYRLYENPIRHSAWLTARPLRPLRLWPITLAVVVLVAQVGIAYAETKSPVQFVPKSPELVSSSHGNPFVRAVVESVRPSQLSQPIPTELAPLPDHLLQDRFDFGTCLQGYGRNAVCRLGSPTPRHTVVVFGDSHTRMWMPGLLYWAKQRHLAVIPLVAEGCVAADWANLQAAEKRCSSWYRWALGEVNRLHPDAVVIGTRYSSAEGGPDMLRQAVRGVITEMRDLVGPRKVALIQDPPAPPRDPVDCILQSGATLGSCAFHLPAAWGPLIEGATRAAAANQGVGFVPTRQLFCAHGTCPMVVRHIIVYMDDRGHISGTYAKWVAPAFARELTRVTGL